MITEKIGNLNIICDAIKGAFIALVASLPTGIVYALSFRFPIPLGGYIGPFAGEHGLENIDLIYTLKSVFIAWIFYGIFGGFIVLIVAGAIAGVIISSKYKGVEETDKTKKNKLILGYGIIIAIIGDGMLSVLDYIIGPW